ncbi:Transposase IS200 like protein [compost metagenome]
MDLYKNKYRIASTRLQNWDYRRNAAYFITICTQNRIHYFGEIISQQMQLTDIGQLAEKFWLEIPNHFPFVELGNFVIMPNHMHGILIINNSIDVAVETRHCLVSTGCDMSRKNSISSIVGSYKSVVTKNARIQFDTRFAWQSRFHDHIIRNSDSFGRIQQYIANNPENWNKDKFHQ